MKRNELKEIRLDKVAGGIPQIVTRITPERIERERIRTLKTKYEKEGIKYYEEDGIVQLSKKA